MVSKIGKEQIDELETLVLIYEAAISAKDVKLSEEADTHFHRLIVHFAENPRLDKMFESVLLQARGFFFNYTPDLPFYAKELFELTQRTRHRKILDAIKKADAVEIEKILSGHINVGLETALCFCDLTNSLKSA
jgi:DNA-binding GntR family transcriptional regulator